MMHPSVTVERIMEMVAEDGCTGLCLDCGLEAYGIEPDAERYECEHCGAFRVYGAEQLLFLQPGHGVVWGAI